ncbi:unnamed protein product [Rotaria sordida]|uniref:Uncharacterized protein n=1 Tax=Rotaria sordida TaxID=392033 RepID=A0A815MM95_9BILA|nr:unnamed protein product [Rotaria sordida]
MMDTGANRFFISIKALDPSYDKQFINKSHSRAILADGYTSLSVFGTMNLFIMMGDMSTSIKALFVKELCANCILGMDFIHKYKLFINTEEQIVSISDNYKRITLKFDINKGNANTRLLQTTNQFKHYGLRRLEQVQAKTFLLIDEAYLWYVEHIDLIISFELFSKLFLQQYSSTSSTKQNNTSVEMVTPSITAPSFLSISHLQQTIADEIIKKPTYS